MTSAPPLNLVTGGAGFIGSHLCHALLAAGERVRVLDDFSSGRAENLSGLGIELLRGDIRDPEVCRQACAGVDFVFHLAAQVSVPQSLTAPELSFAVNTQGTFHLLQAARDCGVRRLIYSSTCAVYGDLPELPKRESSPLRPLSPYAASKLAGEDWCQAFTHSYQLSTVRLRYFNVYGPRQDPGSPYSGVLAIFKRQLSQHRACSIFGNGETTRDFVFVEDVAQANLAARTQPRAHGEVLNIGAGVETSLHSLYQTLADLAGISLPPVYGPARPGDIPRSVADLSHTRSILNWTPAWSLRDGLRRLWQAPEP